MRNEWVSVADAIPPDLNDVLVVRYRSSRTQDKDVQIAHRKIFKNGKVKWRMAVGGFLLGKVTHWRKLPELPSEE